MPSRFRTWYEHERDSNAKTVEMLESVPAGNRSDARYERALILAAHLVACRNNWLDRIEGVDGTSSPWWPEHATLDGVRTAFQECQARWTTYLADLSDAELQRDFEFDSGGTRFRWNVEGQLVQLLGHAFYHRGQIAMLVQELEGKPVDTDYLFWAYPRDLRYGAIH